MAIFSSPVTNFMKTGKLHITSQMAYEHPGNAEALREPKLLLTWCFFSQGIKIKAAALLLTSAFEILPTPQPRVCKRHPLNTDICKSKGNTLKSCPRLVSAPNSV